MTAHTRTARNAALIIVALWLLVLALTGRPHRGETQTITPGPILGYAWSDTTGWIDLNCANQSTCGTVNFAISSASDGTLSGHAWSEHIGWISADASDLAGCPLAPCIAKIEGGAVTGWLKALSGGSSQSGGWDGFISFSGPGYGVTFASQTELSGYAWGSTVIGWADFAFTLVEPSQCTPTFSCVGNAIRNSCTGADTPCPSGYFCPSGASACYSSTRPPTATLRASPALVRPGGTTQVIWNSEYVSACGITGTNNDGTGNNSTGVWSSFSDNKTSSPIRAVTTYTLSCLGEDGSTLTRTATVSIIPIFQEI